MNRYRRDKDAARRRLAARGRRTLAAPSWGNIEYAVWGEGPPVLLSHPLFGGFDIGPGHQDQGAGARMLFGSDLLFWVLKQYAPPVLARILGQPKGFHPTDDEARRVRDAEQSLFPIRPRKRGALFDTFVSNPDVQRYPLQDLAVPTLIINAEDDGLSAFENAARAAKRIPGAKLVAVERGGHLLLGRQSRVRDEIGAFMAGAS
ncbi:TAP-like protein [Nakamurella panacisegetis]|uniref:TAP-like protein n=1 Tax=Nakamurella panacisegetis TaxID=1090615 RepID=A0A1H0SBK0_9ACTN|nr:alpha/beta hydrolase [Nakamurella panacisegetis]SDP38608.1 TAP-like protein [Nakamurella panacisegetis]